MKQSYDKNLDDFKKQIDKYLNKINNVVNMMGGKKEYEEPMLAKNPVKCASCDREIINTKLEKTNYNPWQTISNIMYTPRKTLGSSTGSFKMDSKMDKDDNINTSDQYKTYSTGFKSPAFVKKISIEDN